MSSLDHIRKVLVIAACFALPNRAIKAEIANSDFVFDSGKLDYNQAYEKARRVIASDIRNHQFLAGASWAEVWTRDSSYSIELALNLLHPTLSKRTLLDIKQDVPGIGDCWAQDRCNDFGAWPSLTDAIVGATGAWSLYLATGDRAFLQKAYLRTAHSLTRAERDAFNTRTGLFGGCASFMESNSGYPLKYANNSSILVQTSALSTNSLYYRGYVVAAQMSRELGKDPGSFETKAEALKMAINKYFWQEDKGYYSYFIDENQHLVPQMEGLGESLAILYGISASERTARILRSTPTTAWGFPCLWPQFPEYTITGSYYESSHYHDGMIWPFVQAYWGWAAAKSGDVTTFDQEFGKMLELSEKNDTFMEYYHPEDGRPDGSRTQLWSASGYLGMVYHGLFGIELKTDGIEFSPVVPDSFGHLTLKNFPYRKQVLSITVLGHGSKISCFKINGQTQAKPFLSSSLKGNQVIEITLAARA